MRAVWTRKRGNGRRSGAWRRRIAAVATFLGLLLIVLAACSQVPVISGPPPGDSANVALSDAIQASDPNVQGTEAWQEQNGPYAWAYKVNVGAGQGQNLLLQYYVLNDYGASVSPPLGTANDTQFVAKMKDISSQYAQLSPNHPIVSSIDLVDPVADNVPGVEKLYRHFRSDDSVKHYLQLARDNHMLFFFDTQVGWSTQQHDVSQLIPYLEQPDVNLALDPEWEMRPGDIPGQNRGRTTAASINWVINLLSFLVLSQHLPPKILIVHKFEQDEAPDWQNIQPQPGVSLILSIDGQGYPQAKIDKYAYFSHLGKTNTAFSAYGFKVFLQIPCSIYKYCEEPVMTPTQVLALKPTPAMIQYQ
jgi:hypothetical protein